MSSMTFEKMKAAADKAGCTKPGRVVFTKDNAFYIGFPEPITGIKWTNLQLDTEFEKHLQLQQEMVERAMERAGELTIDPGPLVIEFSLD